MFGIVRCAQHSQADNNITRATNCIGISFHLAHRRIKQHGTLRRREIDLDLMNPALKHQRMPKHVFTAMTMHALDTNEQQLVYNAVIHLTDLHDR